MSTTKYAVRTPRGYLDFNAEVPIGRRTLQQASLHTTVAELFEGAFRQGQGNSGLFSFAQNDTEIVKVRVTPAAEKRVELAETEQAPAGAVVKYAILNALTVSCTGTSRLYLGHPYEQFANGINKAPLFDRQEAALYAIQQQPGRHGFAFTEARIVRIALVNGEEQREVIEVLG